MEAANPGQAIYKDFASVGADARDLSTQQMDQIREWLNGDLFAFAWLIFGYTDLTPSLHGRISDLLGKWGQPGYERLMIQIPREFFKTSLCTRANSLWQVCRDPDAPIAIFNERIDNAAKWLRNIRDVVHSSLLFQRLYNHLLPPGVASGDTRAMPRWWKWSDTELLFQRGKHAPEASITALGMGAASAGGHWPKIIKDDLISEDAARSSTVMAAAKEWFDKSLYLERPALKGMDLICCTPWTYDDLYTHVLEKYNYKLYRRAAMEDGKSIFPEKLTTEELLAHQRRDPYGYSSQMLCMPRPGRDQAFEQQWLRWGSIGRDLNGEPAFIIDKESYDPSICEAEGEDKPPRTVALHSMEKLLLFDPAPSEETQRRKEVNARNGIVVEGIDPWGRRYILEAWADRIDPLEVLHNIFRLMDKWGTNRIAVEEVVFSKLYRHWLLREARSRGRHISCVPLKPESRTKDTRITNKIPGCREGLYYLNKPETGLFFQEYLEYPFGRTRDLLDAWAYDDILKRPLSALETLAMRKRTQEQQRGRDPVTRY